MRWAPRGRVRGEDDDRGGDHGFAPRFGSMKTHDIARDVGLDACSLGRMRGSVETPETRVGLGHSRPDRRESPPPLDRAEGLGKSASCLTTLGLESLAQ